MLLSERATITRRTVARFAPRPFGYGKNDCVAMARHHLRAMGVKVPPMPPYKSLKGALTALKRQDADSVEALIDGQGLARIAPAAMLVGDVATLPGDALSGLVINLGDMVFGWIEGETLPKVLMPEVLEYTAAWRVAP